MELPKLERGDLRAYAVGGQALAGGGLCSGLLRDRLRPAVAAAGADVLARTPVGLPQ